MIAADFSLHNNRPLDCFAFTILPYDAWPAEIEQDVAQALPKDLKDAKRLDDEAMEWLRDPRRFHIAITVNPAPAVFSNGPGISPLAVAREHIAITLDQAVQVGASEDVIRRFRKLKQDAQANNFNVGLLSDIWLLAVWFAVLTIILTRERHCEIIGWFPDRDNMTNYGDGIWCDYAIGNAQTFAEALAIDLTATQIKIGTPDRSKVKEVMWFDYMIRAADWFAGAVAAWDRKRNLIPGDLPKYRQMLEDVITPAKNIVILHLDLTETGMQCRRILAIKKNWFMLILTALHNTARRVVYNVRSYFQE
ncbi:MAG: hypothetical protein K2Z80_08760 [Xanthobacteraceae bacterium]|nr:hypothetical protein [Xanthobacteraceae bacterium]